jgi:hypothetical protein
MEFSEKVVRGERILLACFLVFLAPVLWLENRSKLAEAVRTGQPWLCWLRFPPTNPSQPLKSALAIYQPSRSQIDLISVEPRPGSRQQESIEQVESPLLDKLRLTAVQQPLPRLYVPRGSNVDNGMADPLDERDTLLLRTQGICLWRHLISLLRPRNPETSLPYLDRLVLALELHRLAPERIHTAWLPDNEDDQRTLFGYILTPPSSASAAPSPSITAEVLNASGRQGVASQAKDVLRLQGVDVVNVGNLPEDSPRTVVYDRTGRMENAQAVRDKLGCPQAQTVTDISPKKLVEVTVVLGGDCPDPGRKGGAWNSLRF